jgi:organic radical activating enzyme
MLIKITKSCHNGCTHCFNDAKPSDEHMTLDTFKNVLEFCLKYDNSCYGHMITGGEPTENPLFLSFIDYYYTVYPTNYILTVITNGHFMADNQEIIHEYFDKYPGLLFQVTYDKRYYPNKLDITKRIFHHKRVVVIQSIDRIDPKGRALTNKLEYNTNCPKCFNLKLFLLQKPNIDLKSFFFELRHKINKQCIPCIQTDGYFAFGEYDCCPKIVSIYDKENDILTAIKNFDCKCCPEAYAKIQPYIIEMVKKLEEDNNLK